MFLTVFVLNEALDSLLRALGSSMDFHHMTPPPMAVVIIVKSTNKLAEGDLFLRRLVGRRLFLAEPLVGDSSFESLEGVLVFFVVLLLIGFKQISPSSTLSW